MKKIIGILLSILLFSLNFSACSQGAGKSNAKYDINSVNKDVTEANSEFAFDIFKKLNEEDFDKNIFISPFSISTALTMTYNGAESTTEEAMGKALGYKGISRDTVNQSYNNLLNYLEKADNKVELSIANSIWIRDGEKIKETFLSTNRNIFNAEINTLDFSNESSVNSINKWISNATKGKIEKMLEPPIDKEVIMYLINAIYFKGEWTKKFETKYTTDYTFKAFSGKEQTVKMMSQNGKVRYINNNDYKAVSLPYGSGKTSMYCILPADGININEFIQSMDNEKWNAIRDNMAEVDEVALKLPKFKLEYGIKELNNSLQSLGMGEAFSNTADFSGIRDDVKISRVLHKAVIEVNEEGSEAAAVTTVEIKATSLAEPISFIADRPFVFIIADDSNGTILFMGKLLSVEQ